MPSTAVAKVAQTGRANPMPTPKAARNAHTRVGAVSPASALGNLDERVLVDAAAGGGQIAVHRGGRQPRCSEDCGRRSH